MTKYDINTLHYQIHLLRHELNNNSMPKDVRNDYNNALQLALKRLQDHHPKGVAFACQSHYHRNLTDCRQAGRF